MIPPIGTGGSNLIEVGLALGCFNRMDHPEATLFRFTTAESLQNVLLEFSSEFGFLETGRPGPLGGPWGYLVI